MKIKSFLHIIIIIFLTFSCSTLKTAENQITIDEEKKITEEALPEIIKEYPKIEEPELQAYIQNLGESIVHANQLTNTSFNYTFSVVDSKTINAFALPVGYVFVTAPLLEFVESEDELAGILGHEIGHIKEKHVAKRVQKKQNSNSTLLYSVTGGILGGAAGFGIGKFACDEDNDTCLTAVTGAGTVVGVASGLLVQKFAFLANNRKEELEADQLGFTYAVNAGYSKNLVGNFFARISDKKKVNSNKKSHVLNFQDALSTHPTNQERLLELKKIENKIDFSKIKTKNSKVFEHIRELAHAWIKTNENKNKH